MSYSFSDPLFGQCNYKIIQFREGEPFRILSVLDIQIFAIENCDGLWVQVGGREVSEDFFEGAVRLIAKMV